MKSAKSRRFGPKKNIKRKKGWPLLNVLGQTMAVAIDANNVVLDGNDVVLVMMLLGKKSTKVVDAEGLSPEQVRTLRLSTDTLRRRRDPSGFNAKIIRLQLD